MLRVGYPASLLPELLHDFPEGIELVPLSDKMDRDEAIEIWIPDPYLGRATRTWPHLRGVRLVLSMLAGTEWLPGLVGPHVTICNARCAHSAATAEWALSAILAMFKQIPLFLDIQRAENWRRRSEATTAYGAMTGDARSHYPPPMVEDLGGKTVLIVGYGAIGQEIERMLAPFHVEILRVARRAREVPIVHSVSDLDSLLPRAEIVILILPHTAESHHLIGRPQLARMRQGALLVNAARGGIVHTEALIEALQAGRIRAALDVTDPEPLPEGHPLWKCPNLLITPHIGATTPSFAGNALRVIAAELRRYMNGEPLHNVVQAAT